MYLSPGISEAGAIRTGPGRAPEGTIFESERLSRRELQVLRLIAEGKPTKDIAAGLQISVKTVETIASK